MNNIKAQRISRIIALVNQIASEIEHDGILSVDVKASRICNGTTGEAHIQVSSSSDLNDFADEMPMQETALMDETSPWPGATRIENTITIDGVKVLQVNLVYPPKEAVQS